MKLTKGSNLLDILPTLLTAFARFSYSNFHTFHGLIQKALSGVNANYGIFPEIVLSWRQVLKTIAISYWDVIAVQNRSLFHEFFQRLRILLEEPSE